jgi:uncharacterized protein (TIGR00369 family)
LTLNDAVDTGYGLPAVMKDGPFAGWSTFSEGADPFETLAGPFFMKENAGGAIEIAFDPQPKHLNGGGFLHGGLLMTFADYALFAIAHHQLKSGIHAVTMTMNAEFVGAGKLGDWVRATGEVLRETKSVLFIQGKLAQFGEPVLAFSGTLKKITPR